MIKKMLAVLIVVAMAMVVNVPGASAWFFEIRDLADDHIAELYLDPEGVSLDVGSYTLAFEFDEIEKEYLGYTNTAPSPLTPDFWGELEYYDDPLGTGTSYLLNFNVDNMEASATVTERILIGTLTFGVDTVNSDGLNDIQFLRVDDSYMARVNGEFKNQVDNPEYFRDGPNLDNVPIPSAALLLGSGLLGLIGIGRRKVMG